MWERLKEIVADVAELPAAKREAALVEACGGDTELLNQARELVLSLTGAGDFLDDSPVNKPEAESELVGHRFGPYEIGNEVARGGMGTVYRATNERTGQTVALKVLRAGFGSGDWRRRFEHEVKILGQLRHPAIAQIHDAGVMEVQGDSLPYFAMEFVDGLPLTTFVRQNRLQPRQVVELVIRLCEGVHHAHQRGVIHRDLKPDNLLVTAAGDLKILDFGVARVTNESETELTQVTRAGQIIGTLSYMSPEQVSGDPDRIDTRSDVYALGVILFELLTNQRPYALAGIAMPEAIARIQEQDPQRIGQIDSRLAGDLETIVGAALEKDPARRYQSASELAADLRRFLGDEPIAARPATTLYQLRKFARRHRGLVGGVVVAFLALCIGLAATVWAMLGAEQEAERAQRAEKDAASEAQRARLAEKEAAAEAKRARAAEKDAMEFADFLEDMFESADPEVAGKNMTVVEMLDQNAPRIDKAFRGKPLLRARLHSAIGWDYFGLGELAKAEKYQSVALAEWTKELGADSETTLAEANRYNNTLVWLNRLAEAEPRLRQTLTLATRALGEGSQEALFARSHLAQLLNVQKKLKEAEVQYRKVIDLARKTLGPDRNVTLGARSSLASVLLNAGRPVEAEKILRSVHADYARIFGPRHTKSLVALCSLAVALDDLERRDEAAAVLKEVLKVGESVFGKNSHRMWSARYNYAALLAELGRYQESLQMNRQIYSFYEKKYGEDHTDTILALNNICIALGHLKRYEEAVPQSKKLVDVFLKVRGGDHSDTAQALSTYAGALSGLAESQKGAAKKASLELSGQALKQALAISSKTVGETHPNWLIQSNNYARLLHQIGKYDEAIPLFRKAIDTWETHHPQAPSVVRVFRWNLARSLDALGRFEETEQQLEAALALPTSPHAPAERILRFMVKFYTRYGRSKKLKATQQRLQKILSPK